MAWATLGLLLPGGAWPGLAAAERVPLWPLVRIAGRREATLALIRVAENPRIVVVDFPDLAVQGAALNRVAALIEKRGPPKNRLLDDDGLSQAIAAAGLTPATYFLAHDYRLADLRRAFALAESQGLRLVPAENDLRRRLDAAGLPADGADGEYAVVSISAAAEVEDGGGPPRLTPAARMALLRHELSHGEYFTNPRFRAWCWRFWDGLGPEPRQVFAEELAALGYHAEDEDLIVNETQAILWEREAAAIIDVRLRRLGLGLDRLRARFLAGLDAQVPPVSPLFTLAAMREPVRYALPGQRRLERSGQELLTD